LFREETEDLLLIRSFLAIEIPVAILKEIKRVQGDLRSSRIDVRWVDPEKIHLTLKFFGNIEESRIEPIVESIREPVQATLPFSLQVSGVGAFPHLKNPRVVWVGLIDKAASLIPFQKEVEARLDQIGFPREDRPFQPHLTLGRAKSSRGKDELVGKMEKYKEEKLGEFPVEGLTLFKSELTPSGPIYTRLRELRLGGT
jgi:RNA 2',3'-cyclic 3'-phosphodiesterase